MIRDLLFIAWHASDSYSRKVFDLHDMPYSCSVVTYVTRSSYGRHLLHHLSADRAGLTGGQVAVVAARQIDADLVGG